MTDQSTRNKSYSKGHIAYFYSDMQERMHVLADYFRDGLDNHELCILATPGNSIDAIEGLEVAGLYARTAVASGSFRIVRMKDVYVPDGEFVSENTLKGLAKAIADSRKLGYSGIRIASEMRWINLYPDFLPDAAKYEGDVTKFVDDQHDFVGLCLYPLVSDAVEILIDALLTHPTFMYEGHLHLNPYIKVNEQHKVRAVRDLEGFKALLAKV